LKLVSGKMRIQLEFSEIRGKRIKELMKQTDSDTYKDLFNNALGLFDWAVEQVQDGRIITALDRKENKYRELSMPALTHAAQSANVGAGI
jgi:hypothetical protein